jgi:tetratricopeptide (TPR) repeat protein
MARSLEKRRDSNAALNAYLEALKQNPDRADASLRVAALLDQQGKFQEAQEYYRRVQIAQPQDPDLHCNLGYSLYLQNRWPEAEATLRQAIALNPDHQRARINLGLVLVRLGRGEEALAEFRKAGCSQTEAHLNLAFGLTLDNRWAEARGLYEQVLAADPSSASARRGLQELNGLQARAGGNGNLAANHGTPKQ